MMKKVRFEDDLEIFEVMHSRQLTQQEIKKTWYSTEDFKVMKTNCKILSKELQKFGRLYLLNGLTQLLGDDTNMDENELDGSQHRLILWAKCGESCRGLEKWVNESEGRKRKNLQRLSIEQVLKAQEPCDILQTDEQAEKLKSISESCTFIAKKLARKMAIADAVAASSFRNHEKTKKSPHCISFNKMTSKIERLEAQSLKAPNSTRMTHLLKP
jgi:hypothetical protein